MHDSNKKKTNLLFTFIVHVQIIHLNIYNTVHKLVRFKKKKKEKRKE